MTHPTAHPAVQVESLRKSFGATPVLHGVDLVVPADGVTAILGPSGCGKTTLLRLVAGFETPDGGRITLAGREVYAEDARTAVSAQQRGIGFVPQEGALFPHLTAAANIVFGLSGRRRRQRDRVSELLGLVGLPEQCADRYPHQLSGGQQQRVALARALAPDPVLVLLDEPFASLDAALREETRQATRAALRTAGAAAVLVTHDQDEALSFSDHVAVMREGRIVQSAAPRELYLAPADVGVGRFVGAAVVLPATVSGGVGTCALGPVPLDAEAPEGPAQVLVRPEQIVVHAAPVAGGVGAHVLDVSYYGHDGTARMRLPDGVTVTARTVGYRLPDPGAQVWLTVDGPVLAYRD